MINKLTFFVFLLFSTTLVAQISPVGHLTIFSEDGDKFFLVLNGESQNNIPQTNLRVEDLNQPYYNIKIIFEDKSLMEISKNNLMITDVDGVFSDVTYKIKRDKNNKGKMKLNYFSAIPVRQGYVAPSNVYVMHYGAPREVIVQQASGNVTQTTTTTTSSGQGVNVGVNVGGINMGVSINDNMGGGVVTQTTTTTHTSTVNQGNGYQHEVVRGCGGKYPMATKDFSSALNTVKDQGFEETKLKTAKQIASANCLSVDQVIQIANTFGFEESKLDFAKFAYDYCTEPNNYFKLNGIFSFSSNVDDLSDYVQGKK